MPEDSSDSQKPKLRLKSAAERKAQAETSPETETPTREPSLKLDRSAPESQRAPELAPQAIEPSIPEPEKPAFDPKRPFRNSEGASAEASGSVTKPTPMPDAPPPPASAHPSPPPPEPSIRAAQHTSMLSSLLMIFALIVILGGGGYVIWNVLSAPPSDGTSQTSESAPASNENEKKSSNPIDKTKAAIAKVPVSKAEEVVSEGDAAPAPKAASSESQISDNASDETKETEGLAETAATSPTPSAGDLKDAVSYFLSNAHIGGMRSGENPRIMLNGESYAVGDRVDLKTDLRFVGMQNGKLLFRDKNGIVYAKSF